MENSKLEMSFEPNTIQHLGVKMYSNIPPALAELIANAYDACASEIHIKLYDNDEKKIIVEDNGLGMTFSEVNSYFLRIGRNRRDENQISPCGRTPTGKKGLGKLALFGIGDNIEIETRKKDNEGINFRLSWSEILNCRGNNYLPSFEILPKDDTKIGTKITLTKLKRQTGFPIDDYTESLAKLFNFPNGFEAFISLNDGSNIKIDNQLKYQNIKKEYEWKIEDIIKVNNKGYEHKDEIIGIILTTEKPLRPNLRGITLFANGRMVNLPEFFGLSESSHFFSYTTGWINVDFIDNMADDVISTNRQSLDWENIKTIELRNYLASCITLVERQWREERKKTKRANINKSLKLGVDDWLGKLPKDTKDRVEKIVTLLEDSPSLPKETQEETLKILHELIPEYVNLHWRHLEEDIRKASETKYKNKDYYNAFIEGLKKYLHEVRLKSGSRNNSEQSMVGEVFPNILSVTKKYTIPDKFDFSAQTIKNIEEGQKFLSMGIIAGGRNPLQHEEHVKLNQSGLFSEKDCLDFLSLLSHLYKRLNESERNL